jgi:hypothetical protein
MNRDEVKKAYLSAVGDPESGVFVDFADAISEAIVKACCPEEEEKAATPVKEIRVVEAKETR